VVSPSPRSGEAVTPPRSRSRPSPRVGRGGGHLPRSRLRPSPGGRARRRPSSEAEVEAEPWGRARRRPSSEAEAGAEVESESWGRARRRPSSEVEAGAEPRGRARRSLLWRLRLDSAAVSITLAGGTAVGAGQATLFSCQVS
jgi:hypothetical protein